MSRPTHSRPRLTASLNNRHPARAHWLLHGQMPEYPPSLLAMTRLRQALAALQAQLNGKDPVETPAAHLAQVCEDIEQAVIEAICHLAYGQLSLQSVLDLLDYLDDDVRLPPSRLHELLLPLDRRMEQSLAQLIRVL